MSAIAQNAQDVIYLRIEVQAPCRRAHPVATSVYKYDTVFVCQVLLLREGLLRQIETSVDEDNRLTLPDLNNVQICIHRATPGVRHRW